MQCFVCELADEHPVLVEHRSSRRLDVQSLETVDWLLADIEVADAIKAAKLLERRS